MMRVLTIVLILMPIISYAQEVKIDKVGNEGRIVLPGTLRSILIGQDVGNANSTGINNIFIGKENGSANTSGAYNVTLGQFAGALNTSGSQNTFLGYVAGYQNTIGSDNIFLGRSAGISNLTGSFNTFIGSGANGGSGGNSNIMIGHQTGGSAETDHSIAIGDSALFNSNANENIAIGSKAAYSFSSGKENVIIGTRAGMNTNLSQNVLLGYEAGRYSSGAKKIAIGFQAGMYASGGSIAIGEQANLSNGSNTIALGNFAAANGNSSSSIFIGNYAGYDENNDHRLRIGNLGYGTIIYGELDNRKIRINNNLETGEFHVKAHDNINHATLFMQSQTGPESRVMILEAGTENIYLGDIDGTGGSTIFYSDGNERMRILGNGKIGIGTSSPGDRLQIDASAGEDALRVRIGGTTRLRVHDNGGVSIGANRTPPSAGMVVENLRDSNDGYLRANGNGHIYKEGVKTDYYSVTAHDFNAAPGIIHSDIFISVPAGLATSAPVHLPNGSKIKAVRIYVLDNQAIGDIVVKLNQKTHTTQYTYNTLATVQSTSSNSLLRNFTNTLNHIVDNANNLYWLDVSAGGAPGSPFSLYSVRIEYEH
ncbi:MAG: hypothetical protein AAGK97_06140 [Bacteroidota bacterium]